MALVRIYRLFALVAALCVALTSVASASRLAPVDMPSDALFAFIEAGGSLADLCGDADLNHTDHDCPFCRLVSDPPAVAPTQVDWRVLFPADDPRLVGFPPYDLRLARHDLARGPPCSAT